MCERVNTQRPDANNMIVTQMTGGERMGTGAKTKDLGSKVPRLVQQECESVSTTRPAEGSDTPPSAGERGGVRDDGTDMEPCVHCAALKCLLSYSHCHWEMRV